MRWRSCTSATWSAVMRAVSRMSFFIASSSPSVRGRCYGSCKRSACAGTSACSTTATTVRTTAACSPAFRWLPASAKSSFGTSTTCTTPTSRRPPTPLIGCFSATDFASRRRLLLEQPLAPDGEEYGEDHRADEQAHQAEGGEAAEHAEEHDEKRDLRLAADEERADDVVHPAHDEASPDEQPHGRHHAALHHEPQHDSAPDGRCGEGDQSANRGERGEKHRRGDTGKPVADPNQQALHQRREYQAVDDRPDGLLDGAQIVMDARTEHLLERMPDLPGESLPVAIREEQAHHGEEQLDGVAGDTAYDARDALEGVVGDLAQLEAEGVRIGRGARGQVAQLLTDPRQAQYGRRQLYPTGKQVVHRMIGAHHLETQHDCEPHQRRDDGRRHRQRHQDCGERVASTAPPAQPFEARPGDEREDAGPDEGHDEGIHDAKAEEHETGKQHHGYQPPHPWGGNEFFHRGFIMPWACRPMRPLTPRQARSRLRAA